MACCRDLSFSSSPSLRSTPLHLTQKTFSNEECQSSTIYCFRPEEKHLSQPSKSIEDNNKSSNKKAHRLLSKMHASLIRRISDLTKRRQLNTALQILDEAILSNYKPNQMVMNTALAACVHCRDLSRAYIIFKNMLEPGNCGVNDVTYAILLKGLGESRMFDDAFELVEALEDGTVPGESTLTEVHLRTLLNAFADAGDMMRALGALSRYRSTFNRSGPSIFTYNILIKGYTRSTNPMEALKLRDDINRLGLEPERITFNSLILACVRGGDMTEAFKLLGEMKEAAERFVSSELLPDIVTYTTLIQGCGQQGDCDGLSSLVKEMKSSEGCKVDRIAYGVIIDAFVMTETSSGLKEGLLLLEEMVQLSKEKKDLRPKPHVFLSLMRAFAAKGDIEVVQKLHSEMIPLASGPVTPQHRVEADELFIEAAVNNGQLGLAMKHLKDMKGVRKGLPLSSRGYLAIIRLNFLCNVDHEMFEPFILREEVSMNDPVSKWMHTVEDRKAPLPDAQVSEVMMQFFRDPVVPVVDEVGKCVGVVHREDCYELNVTLGSIMRGPPPTVPANTSVGRAVTLLLESEARMVAVLEIKRDYVFAKNANDKVVGFLTLDRVLSLKVDYQNLLMNRMKQFLIESEGND